MKESKKEKPKSRDIPANAIIIPLEILLAGLLIFIFILGIELNRSNNKLSNLLERSGLYQQLVWDLQAGVNTLAETSGNYIQRPINEDGSPSVGPLMTYVEELGRDRRASDITERFRVFGVNDEVQNYLDKAAATAGTMMETQTHAISLMRSVFPLPPIPELSAIPEVPLTEEELAMTEEARIGHAKEMILNPDYAKMKYHIAEDINACNSIFTKEFTSATIETRMNVKTLRTMLWIVIAIILVVLFIIFAVVQLWLIKPLRKHAKEISSDENMSQTSGIREMRVLVNAYNGLLIRRNKLESILRSAAETDSLTGLPNRYSLERYLLEAEEDNSAMAVVMFDVNFLKRVNDTQGHPAGDRLLRTVGNCILECFASEDNNNCYRLGGDEFAAILRNCSEDDVKSRLERFNLSLERESISVSVGYAFAQETDEGSYKKLLDEADARMYKMKKQVHESSSSTLRNNDSSSDFQI